MKTSFLLIIISILSISSFAIANLDKAPKSFKHKGLKTNFIDIKAITTHLNYDINKETVMAKSVIQFETKSDGHPIFDLRPNIIKIEIDGLSTTALKITDPDHETNYQLVNKSVKAGTHTLEITNSFDTNILFDKDSVASGFWMSDLRDRKYIEQYLPTNIEFDQYQLDLTVEVSGTNIVEHKIYTNGSLTETSKNNFKISFPDYFTASSFYFHLAPKNKFKEKEFVFESMNGSSIPVIAYTGSTRRNILNTAKKTTLKVLKELEGKLGAWSHPSLTIYLAGSGGMEHSGATITSMRALGHELIHSYFARGVMPINGNAGWMDEAIASWRDKGYKKTNSPNFSSTEMSAHSQYKRSTDRKAYTQGANFMAYLNKRLESQGGLITFLSEFYKKYSHENISTEIFKKNLEEFSGEDFTSEFKRYIYGSRLNKKMNPDLHIHEDNPYHKDLSKKELLDLL